MSTRFHRSKQVQTGRPGLPLEVAVTSVTFQTELPGIGRLRSPKQHRQRDGVPLLRGPLLLLVGVYWRWAASYSPHPGTPAGVHVFDAAPVCCRRLVLGHSTRGIPCILHDQMMSPPQHSCLIMHAICACARHCLVPTVRHQAVVLSGGVALEFCCPAFHPTKTGVDNANRATSFRCAGIEACSGQYHH
jgi:hypothetical protein